MKKMALPLLVALVLVLVSQAALAGSPEPNCRITVEKLAVMVAPMSRELPEPPADLPDGLAPAPLFKAVIGDCCPGNNVANCPPVSGWHVRCDSPHCETGEYSCLYWR
jgi:hypothetical protein